MPRTLKIPFDAVRFAIEQAISNTQDALNDAVRAAGNDYAMPTARLSAAHDVRFEAKKITTLAYLLTLTYDYSMQGNIAGSQFFDLETGERDYAPVEFLAWIAVETENAGERRVEDMLMGDTLRAALEFID